MTSWANSTFAALGNRKFRTLWLGSFLAFIAFFMSTVVQAVVAFDLSGNNRAVGFVVFAQGIAQLALGPLGGALADRLSKKTVILTCQLVIMVSFFVVGVLIATDAITVAYLAIGSFVIGVAFSFLGPSRQAFMMELVEDHKRGNAVALSQVALNASRILAPLIAGALLAVGALGPEVAFIGMGLLYVGAITTTFLLPDSRPPAAANRSVFGDIATGIGYVARHSQLRLLVSSYILVIMFGFTYVTVLPGFVENELGHDPESITFLLGVNAIGGLGASLGVAALADSKHARMIYSTMCLVFGLSVIGMALAPSYAVLAAVMFIGGIGGGGFQTLNGAIVSHLTHPDYFGRVVSLTFLAFASSSMVALPVGFLADGIGERQTLLITGAIVCAITVLFWLLQRATGPIAHLRIESTDPEPAG